MPIRDYTDSPREGHGLKIQCPYLESEDLKSGKRNRVIGNLKRKEDYLESRLRSSPGARAAGTGRAGGGAGRVHTLWGARALTSAHVVARCFCYASQFLLRGRARHEKVNTYVHFLKSLLVVLFFLVFVSISKCTEPFVIVRTFCFAAVRDRDGHRQAWLFALRRAFVALRGGTSRSHRSGAVGSAATVRFSL